MNLLTASLLALMGATLSGCGTLGFLRYGLTQGNPGQLHPGDTAPDVGLVDTTGEPVQLYDSIGQRPLVLIFGSFT